MVLGLSITILRMYANNVGDAENLPSDIEMGLRVNRKGVGREDGHGDILVQLFEVASQKPVE